MSLLPEGRGATPEPWDKRLKQNPRMGGHAPPWPGARIYTVGKWAVPPDPLPDFGSDPLPGESCHRACATVREMGPVVEVPFHGGSALFLTRSEDVVGAFRDNERFPAGAHYEIVIEPVQGRTFESMDGDEHNLYRQLAQPA
ncbi:MAG: hypothetical protein VYC25_01850, partial [Actinomycetota bacterium]|nr:hypothetical protein [Actinomycetota bacterium]